jgi:phosphopentomutase
VTVGRFFFIILDSCGIGALPDAEAYGDAGANTVGNIARAVEGLDLPNLERLGLGNVVDAPGIHPMTDADGCFGRMMERSKGKDSTTGHWELAGIVTTQAFPLYPEGFPQDLLLEFLKATGCGGYLGNKPASGTEIIKELGDEHVRTGFPIVYTSGDSVFQIAAHEQVIPLDKLHEICRITRESVTIGTHSVGRVIARPFIGTSHAYTRTAGRKDFAVAPLGVTVLDVLSEAGIDTVAIGKIDDLFSGRGLRTKIHTTSNADGIAQILEAMRSQPSGFLMANLVDFDMLYGHRQDPHGFARALTEFDAVLPRMRSLLREGDILLITADHGNDPTDNSTDHTREYVPVLIATQRGPKNIALGTRQSFADAGKTVLDYFGIQSRTIAGDSFLGMIRTS